MKRLRTMRRNRDKESVRGRVWWHRGITAAALEEQSLSRRRKNSRKYIYIILRNKKAKAERWIENYLTWLNAAFWWRVISIYHAVLSVETWGLQPHILLWPRPLQGQSWYSLVCNFTLNNTLGSHACLSTSRYTKESNLFFRQASNSSRSIIIIGSKSLLQN